MLATLGVNFLQGVAAWSGVIVCLVQQVVVARVARLPQQVLLIGLLPEAGVTQVLYILLLYLSLQLAQAARELRVEILLHIVTDPHIGGFPLDVILVSRIQVIQGIVHLIRTFIEIWSMKS